MEEAILVAEEKVEALQAESNDPDLANNHERMTTVWADLAAAIGSRAFVRSVERALKASRADQSSSGSNFDGRVTATSIRANAVLPSETPSSLSLREVTSKRLSKEGHRLVVSIGRAFEFFANFPSAPQTSRFGRAVLCPSQQFFWRC